MVRESAALIDTVLQARMFEKTLEYVLIPWLHGYKVERREIVRYNSRFDYLLSNIVDRILLELKSAVYLSSDGDVMYPDTISERGVKHFKTLSKGKEWWGMLRAFISLFFFLFIVNPMSSANFRLELARTYR